MCCFSGGPGVVQLVAKTNLFARASGNAQLLAYSMNVAAVAPVAMILPLPVPPRPAEDAVRFIDLSQYADLFGDLDRGFPPLVAEVLSAHDGAARGAVALPTLEVHQVGSFEASFVPTPADFARLDGCFRLSADVWSALPQVHDWGFAVFKLRDLRSGWFGRKKTRTIHPMAFEFPRRNPRELFFPTVHVHDGTVHPRAEFDHTLYYQSEHELAVGPYHQTSEREAAVFVDVARAGGLVDGAARVKRAVVSGERPNMDVILVDEPLRTP